MEENNRRQICFQYQILPIHHQSLSQEPPISYTLHLHPRHYKDLRRLHSRVLLDCRLLVQDRDLSQCLPVSDRHGFQTSQKHVEHPVLVPNRYVPRMLLLAGFSHHSLRQEMISHHQKNPQRNDIHLANKRSHE